MSLRAQTEALERGDAVAAAEGDAAFHRTLVLVHAELRATRADAGAHRREPQERVRRLLAAGDGRRSLGQHRQIVEALAASDVEGAARLAQEHMLDVARRSQGSQSTEARPTT